MGTPRSSQVKAGTNPLLWVGVVLVLTIVLAMGVALMRLQAQPEEMRRAVMPALEAPPAIAAPALASAAAEARPTAAALPPAFMASDPIVNTQKPRIIHPNASEPAVARAPQRVLPNHDAAGNDTPPGATR